MDVHNFLAVMFEEQEVNSIEMCDGCRKWKLMVSQEVQ